MENRMIVLFFMLAALSFIFTLVAIPLLRLRAKQHLRILPLLWSLLFLFSTVPAHESSYAAELALFKDYTDGLRIELHAANAESEEDVPEFYLSHRVLSVNRGVCTAVVLLWSVSATASFTFGLADYFNGMQYLTRHSAVCRDERLCTIYERAKKRVGIRRSIPLRLMKPEVCISPCTCGIIFPSVYVGGELEEYSELWLELIFMHELTHIKHCDTFTKLFTLLATSFHALLPISRVIRSAVAEDLEYLCDEAVLDKVGDSMRREYISMILSTAERDLTGKHRGAEVLSYLSPNGQAILRRYYNMKDRHGRRGIVRAVPPLLIGALLNLCLMSAVRIRSFDDLGIDLADPVLRSAVCDYFELDDPHELTEGHLRQIYSIEFSRPGFPEERQSYACILNEQYVTEALHFTSDVRVMDTRDIVLFDGLRTLIFSDRTESSVAELYESTSFAIIIR